MSQVVREVVLRYNKQKLERMYSKRILYCVSVHDDGDTEIYKHRAGDESNLALFCVVCFDTPEKLKEELLLYDRDPQDIKRGLEELKNKDFDQGVFV